LTKLSLLYILFCLIPEKVIKFELLS
jgi:hypothetical protein